MRSINRVNYELSCLQVYYRNAYLYQDDTSLLALVKVYETAIESAPLKLMTVFRLVYKYNNSLAVAAEEMQISVRTMIRLNNKLKYYFQVNLWENIL